MSKVIEKVRLMNIFEAAKSVELDALIDTGATMMVLPQGVVDELGLRKMREATVRYGNGKVESKSVYGVVTAETKGRAGEFDVIAEPESVQALVGQILLGHLALIVDPGSRCVAPYPRSPDVPMVDVL